MLLIERIGKEINNNAELMENKNIMFFITPETDINNLINELEQLQNINIDKTSPNFINILKIELEYFQELYNIFKSDVIFKDDNLFLVTPKHKQLTRMIIKELEILIKQKITNERIKKK